MVAFFLSFFRLFINFLFSVAAVTIFGGPRPKELEINANLLP